MENSSVLIVGGGVGGMAAAITLRQIGLRVDLIDHDPQWRVYGAGITITRPTLRAFHALGVLNDFLETGFAGDGIQISDVEGRPVSRVADPPLPEDESIPGSGGIMRPDLHRILSTRVLASGADVRLGITTDSFLSHESGVDVIFSDGSSRTYDFVIGADGLFSKVRQLILPHAPRPSYTGQTVWRLFAPRPPEIVRRNFFLGGRNKVGITPVSKTHLYMFLLEVVPQRPITPDAELPGLLRELMAGYGGIIGELRDGLNDASPIVMRPLEAFLLPPPWNVGRVLLIGDAAHPTTPQLASGAGMAVEDALVLAEEFSRAGGSPIQAFQAYTNRRWERCQLVVENSIEIGRREQAGAPPSEQTILVEQALAKLAEPI